MKKILILVFALVMLVALSACGGEYDSTSTVVGTETNTAPLGDVDNNPVETTNPTDDNILASDPIHTHKYAEKTVAATCTEDGYTLHTCSCGNSYSDNKTNSTGHSFGEWNTTKNPTATSTGAAERKCSNCNEKETKVIGQLIDNHTHSYTSKVTKPATCKTEGTTTFSCSCGDAYTASITRTSHKYTDSVIKPTCTNGGYTTHNCSVCGDSFSDNNTNPTGHNWNDATCTTPKTCTYCKKTHGIAKGHTIAIDIAIEPTCIRTGLTEGKHCSVCETIIVQQNIISANGHDESDWIIDTDATCTTMGSKYRICSVCTIKLEEKIIEKRNHTYSDWITDSIANCTTDGSKHRTCSICSIVEVEKSEKLEHAKGLLVSAEKINNSFIGTWNCNRCNVQFSKHYDPIVVTLDKTMSYYSYPTYTLTVNATGGLGGYRYQFIICQTATGRILSMSGSQSNSITYTDHNKYNIYTNELGVRVTVYDQVGQVTYDFLINNGYFGTDSGYLVSSYQIDS